MDRFSIVAVWPFTVMFVRGRAPEWARGGAESRRSNRPREESSMRRRLRASVLNSGSVSGGARKTSTETSGFTTGWSPVL